MVVVGMPHTLASYGDEPGWLVVMVGYSSTPASDSNESICAFRRQWSTSLISSGGLSLSHLPLAKLCCPQRLRPPHSASAWGLIRDTEWTDSNDTGLLYCCAVLTRSPSNHSSRVRIRPDYYPPISAATPLHFQLTAFSPSHQTLTPSQSQTSAASYRMYESNPSEAPTPPNTPSSQNSVQQQQPRGSDHQMNQYAPPPQAYGTQSMQLQITMASSHSQPIALDPASGRVFSHLHPIPAGGVRLQSGVNSPYGPGAVMPGDIGEANRPLHVVGYQGCRGILPSALGRPITTPAGAGNTRSTVIPVKDADGKFPCPHCTKTYLHAKHLKRHLLRHTGDRPYMCVLCRDTFSRSDILKRHFQKCSIRRGNLAGASHLSHSEARVKSNGGPNHPNGLSDMTADTRVQPIDVTTVPDEMRNLQIISQLSRTSSLMKSDNDSPRQPGVQRAYGDHAQFPLHHPAQRLIATSPVITTGVQSPQGPTSPPGHRDSLFFSTWNVSPLFQSAYTYLSNQICSFVYPSDSPIIDRAGLRLHSAENVGELLGIYTRVHVDLPVRHTSEFRIMDAYPGLLVAMCCVGACYYSCSPDHLSDVVSFLKSALARDLLSRADLVPKQQSSSARADTSSPVQRDIEEAQALFLLHFITISQNKLQHRERETSEAMTTQTRRLHQLDTSTALRCTSGEVVEDARKKVDPGDPLGFMEFNTSTRQDESVRKLHVDAYGSIIDPTG
ncbi:hypothetical protein BDP55DRAFT_638801 [Colletotrichum godetiae]|uniref:C2H2-type domain-containing protein n=1 Tax=Colletotrichum godetiae TaxID=1209918 RepID=A0AAJ0A952_9PEZI|nr:uncharacterized protein BDP55DRAFT_638801 [Colletotrichum godetiae]KAK1657341.1 hypothetical protein BDP55DRAFT_638801 [Colletotrichum godetiae]